MDKGQLALNVLRNLCRHLAREGVLDSDAGTDIVGQWVEHAVMIGDHEAVKYLNGLEKIIADNFRPKVAPACYRDD